MSAIRSCQAKFSGTVIPKRTLPHDQLTLKGLSMTRILWIIVNLQVATHDYTRISIISVLTPVYISKEMLTLCYSSPQLGTNRFFSKPYILMRLLADCSASVECDGLWSCFFLVECRVVLSGCPTEAYSPA